METEVQMNTFVSIILGLIGIYIGLFIPEFSLFVIKKKKGMDYTYGNSLLSIRSYKICFGLINGLIWLLAGIFLDTGLKMLFLSIQVTLGLVIAFIDIKIRIIPNELVLTMFVVGVIFQAIYYGLHEVLGSVACMIFIMVVFTAVAIFMGFGKVGAGDVKLAGAIGFSLGYPLVVVAMLTMAVVLLLYIVTGLAIKKIKLTTMLPLAPFLIVGYVFSLLTLIIGVNFY